MGRAFASKDFLAGGLYMAFGLLGLWLGRTLDVGSASAMEAGYFPRLVCGLLIAVGAALAAMSLLRAGEIPERGRWRPLIFVTLSCLAFALLLHPLGLVLTLLVSILLACLAGGQYPPGSVPAALPRPDRRQCRDLRARVAHPDRALAGALTCPTSCPISRWVSASR